MAIGIGQLRAPRSRRWGGYPPFCLEAGTGAAAFGGTPLENASEWLISRRTSVSIAGRLYVATAAAISGWRLDRTALTRGFATHAPTDDHFAQQLRAGQPRPVQLEQHLLEPAHAGALRRGDPAARGGAVAPGSAGGAHGSPHRPLRQRQVHRARAVRRAARLVGRGEPPLRQRDLRADSRPAHLPTCR